MNFLILKLYFMAAPVSLTQQLGSSSTLGDGSLGTVTSVVFGGVNVDNISFANAAIAIPSGLTVTVQITNDLPDVATWVTLATGITNKPITDPYLVTVPCRGVKLVRTAGSGVTSCTVLQSGGSSSVTAAGNVASGATDSGNPVKVGGVYNSTLPTFTTGQRADLQTDSNGRLIVTQGTLIRGENETLNRMMTIGSSTPTRITTATTTAVKASAGTVVGVFVEVALTGTVTLNDNVTTMIILPIGTIAGFHPFPASFATSLNVITSAHDRLVTLTV